MSFRCEGPACEVITIGPRVKPTLSAAYTRSKAYSVMVRDEVTGDLRPGTSAGFETVRELRLCPSCAEVPPPAEHSPEAELSLLRDQTFVRGRLESGAKDHRKGCKDFTGECRTCASYIDTARRLPLDRLSAALEDPMARTYKTSMAFLVLEGIRRRSGHNTRRAGRDMNAAYAHLAPFSKRSGPHPVREF